MISIGRGVKTAVTREYGATVQVQVAPADLDAALRALQAVVPDIYALDAGWRSAYGLGPGDTNGPKYVSDPVAVPTGPIISWDPGGTTRALLATIPGLIVARLEQQGVTEAVIAAPRNRVPDKEIPPDNGVLLWLIARLPVTRATYDDDAGVLTEVLLDWMYPDGRDLVRELTLIDVSLPATRSLAETLAADGMHSFLSLYDRYGPGYADRRLTYGGLDRSYRFNVSLGLCGDDVPEAQIMATALRFRGIAESLADRLAWAGVHVGPGRGRVLSGLPPGSLTTAPEYVQFDALWWQLLGPMHRVRLRGLPAGSQPLGQNQVGVQLGKLEDWLPGSRRRTAVHEAAVGAIRPLIRWDFEREYVTDWPHWDPKYQEHHPAE